MVQQVLPISPRFSFIHRKTAFLWRRQAMHTEYRLGKNLNYVWVVLSLPVPTATPQNPTVPPGSFPDARISPAPLASRVTPNYNVDAPRRPHRTHHPSRRVHWHFMPQSISGSCRMLRQSAPLSRRGCMGVQPSANLYIVCEKIHDSARLNEEDVFPDWEECRSADTHLGSEWELPNPRCCHGNGATAHRQGWKVSF